MRRRQLLATDIKLEIEGNPRRMRTRQGAPATHQTIWRAGVADTSYGHYKPQTADNLSDIQKSWIGKKIIYMDNRVPSRNGVQEYEIAKYAQPEEYRIIIVNSMNGTSSKVTGEYIPSRMNIFVDTNDVIVGINYF